MPPSSRRRPLWGLAVSLLAVALCSAGERSHPLDCLPDRVVAWEAAEPNSESRFGAVFLPGIVLGPPGDSLAFQGALTVASLGFGGGVLRPADHASGAGPSARGPGSAGVIAPS